MENKFLNLIFSVNFYLFFFCFFSNKADATVFIGQGIAISSSTGAVVAGIEREGNSQEIIVARYLIPTGALDTNFNSPNGYVVTAIGEHAYANSVAIDSDKKIVIAGIANGNFLVARYTVAGVLDTANFASPNGYVNTTIGDGSEALDAKIQSDGKIVVAGVANESGQPKFALARYNTDGTIDTGFGTSGIVKTSIGSIARAQSLIINGSGNIIVAGYAKPLGQSNSVAIARYSSAGVIDTSFGTPNGYVTTAIGLNSQVKQVFMDGTNIVVSGITQLDDEHRHYKMLLARYSSTGAVDTSFASPDGYVTAEVEHNTFGTCGALTTASKYLVGGYSDEAFVFLAQYTNTGAIDASLFGTTGVFKLRGLGIQELHALALESGNILTAGVENSAFSLLRVSSTGVLDSNFGYQGRLNQPAGLLTDTQIIVDIVDQKFTGTNAGTPTTTWNTRSLNTIRGRFSGFVNLSNNIITLAPGNYQILASAPAVRAGGHQIRLWNITENKAELYGTSENSTSTSTICTSSSLSGLITLTNYTQFRVEHYVSNSFTNGLGLAVSQGPETYAWVRFIRLGL